MTAACLLAIAAHSASAAMISEDFETVGVGTDATPAGWSYLNINGGANQLVNIVGYNNTTNTSAGVAPRITGDNTVNANQPPGSYIVNDGGVAFDTKSSISGSFDYIILNPPSTLGRAQGGVFMMGDVSTGIAGATNGSYIGMQMMSDSFGNRGQVIFGDGTSNNDTGKFVGNQRENQWYNIEFTWTPTSGTTGNFSASGQSYSSSSSWTAFFNGYTFDSDQAYFGFGAGDYYNNKNTVAYDNISIEGTEWVDPNAIPSPTAALAGLIGMGALVSRRRRQR